MTELDAHRALLETLNRGVEGLPVPRRRAGEASPCFFVTGVPRSGTTLLYQLLCASGALGYVSNLMARFYRNPAFGAGVQELLRPLLPEVPWSYASEYGRTGAWHEPHEFGFFWERHLPFDHGHDPEPEELADVDWARIHAELTSLADFLALPLVLKNNILACVTPALGQWLPGSIFVEVRRDPVDVAHSLLRARRKEAGGKQAWWSTRVRGWRELERRPAAEQLVEQIAHIDEAHRRARRAVGEERWRVVHYGKVCRDPRAVVAHLLDGFGLGESADLGRLPERFSPSVAEPGSEPALENVKALLEDRGVRGEE